MLRRCSCAGLPQSLLQRSRRCHEALGRQIRSPPIAPGKAEPTDVEVARHARRNRAASRVQNIDGRVSDGAPDRNGSRGQADLGQRRPNRRFRGTVNVPKRPASCEQFVGEVARQRLAAAQDAQSRQAAPARLDQAPPSRRRRLHDGAPARHEQRRQQRRIHGGFSIRQDHPAAAHQGKEDFERGDVE